MVGVITRLEGWQRERQAGEDGFWVEASEGDELKELS